MQYYIIPKKLSISAEVLTTNLSGKRVKLLIHCNQLPLCATELEGGGEGKGEGGRREGEREGGSERVSE